MTLLDQIKQAEAVAITLGLYHCEIQSIHLDAAASHPIIHLQRASTELPTLIELVRAVPRRSTHCDATMIFGVEIFWPRPQPAATPAPDHTAAADADLLATGLHCAHVLRGLGCTVQNINPAARRDEAETDLQDTVLHCAYILKNGLGCIVKGAVSADTDQSGLPTIVIERPSGPLLDRLDAAHTHIHTNLARAWADWNGCRITWKVRP